MRNTTEAREATFAQHSDVVIVGAGHGGAQCAISLRQNGFTGSITVIGRESELPYERPPLSKEYLARDKSFERILIRPSHFWADKDISMRLGVEVVAIAATNKIATLSTGDTVSYDAMIWAAGADPRRLTCAGADLSGVHSVRTRADIDRLLTELDQGSRNAVVIGGGYIGLEAAAVLSKLGCKVTLLEAQSRVLARVAGEQISAFYEAEHRTHGVDIRTNVQVESVEGNGVSVTGVMLKDGTILPADIVIAGIGILPCVAPLLDAGAAGGNGVHIDDFCRTTLPDIYAIGDCAAHASEFADGAMVRIESVQNANDMAITAAKAICGASIAYRSTPWFWSNQYDLRLQTVGLSNGHDQTVLRGDPATRAFTVVYLKSGRIVALDCVNRVKDYVQGKKLVELGATIAADLLSRHDVPLKDIG